MILYVKRVGSTWAEAEEVKAVAFSDDECESVARLVLAQELHELAMEEPHAEHVRKVMVNKAPSGDGARLVIIKCKMAPTFTARVKRCRGV